jgi:hypothetical protein
MKRLEGWLTLVLEEAADLLPGAALLRALLGAETPV